MVKHSPQILASEEKATTMLSLCHVDWSWPKKENAAIRQCALFVLTCRRNMGYKNQPKNPLLWRALFRLQDEEACGCYRRVWFRASNIGGSPEAADHSPTAAYHHRHHRLDWQQNVRWVKSSLLSVAGWTAKCQVGKIIIMVNGGMDSKMAGRWRWTVLIGLTTNH